MKKIFKKDKIRVARTAVLIWRIDLTLLMVPVAAIIALVGAFIPLFAVVLGAVSAAVYVFGMMIYIPLYCKNLNYTFDEEYITVRKGVIYKRKAVIPLSSVQYCVLIEGLLQKRFRRCSVALMLAGSFVLIRQIRKDEGDELVAALKELEQKGAQPPETDSAADDKAGNDSSGDNKTGGDADGQ